MGTVRAFARRLLKQAARHCAGVGLLSRDPHAACSLPSRSSMRRNAARMGDGCVTVDSKPQPELRDRCGGPMPSGKWAIGQAHRPIIDDSLPQTQALVLCPQAPKGARTAARNLMPRPTTGGHMARYSLAFACAIAPCTIFAGELVRDATVTEVANTAFGGAEFAVRLSGGTGVCAAATFIIFPEAKAASAASNKQAIATALLAFSTGKKVRIHNFQDDSCVGANFISISN